MIHFILLYIAMYHPDDILHPDDIQQYIAIKCISAGWYIASNGKLLISVTGTDCLSHFIVLAKSGSVALFIG